MAGIYLTSAASSVQYNDPASQAPGRLLAIGLSFAVLGFLAATLTTYVIQRPASVVVHTSSGHLQSAVTSQHTIHHMTKMDGPTGQQVSRRDALMAGAAAASLAAVPLPAAARIAEDVSRPDLLPQGPVVNIIDLIGILSPSEVKEVERSIEKIEKLFGVKLRILCQRYPVTPGQAVEEYWNVDDNTILIIVDDSYPNFLNFELGQNVNILAPNGRFWTQLRAKYGTVTFRRKNGDSAAIVEAVEAILDGLTLPYEMGSSMMLGI